MKLDEDYEKPGFLQKYGFLLGIVALLVVAGVLLGGKFLSGKKEAPRKAPEIVMIRPIPTPPPPAQPKPPEPPKEVVDQMVKQDTVTPDDEKPDEAPAPASAGLTTNNSGTGGVDMGLGAAGKGGAQLAGGARGPRSQFGWYAAQVQTTIQGALSRNTLTAKASFENEVRIWADITGRIIRVKLKGSTGDAAVDRAINETLGGLLLQQPPPTDMKMPIVMRLKASRPN